MTQMKTIETGRGGIMPAWVDRLDPVSIKMVALYVYSLGGGHPLGDKTAAVERTK